ncbi:cation:proton antiporter [Pseudobacteroides cellulosolvens]|uniref:Sodium/hydrogen exchanger n=1 Tax=Pseudobacteroides cellulosolvens ATCC 35603 = DSM 2933 TaxID=398512 RepID=A0A0L6JRE6_9FIRM|nr:cation:proton antiporter [Pseudobacteroides cellulosolvens]KNY28349.1 sodium/hydrogen exchanger [Pseudobacteroides cellulosolvens ATCC 35603 = DSM 2933]
MEHDILFDLGIILFLGFFAAIAMKKLGQSVIAGYMAVGLIIGPKALGLIKNTELLSTLSELGIVLLMFFLGLEFSINKFKKIKNSVFFIGTYEVILNLIVGFIIGTVLGFAFKERLFLTCIIALSSSGVVAKLLFDMKRTASKESEILMGVMVYEDFFAILILGILSSFTAADKAQIPITEISVSMLKALGFYAFFIIIGILFINKIIDILTRIDSQELFTALMIGLILLTSSLALHMGLASAAGAFLLGMLIVSYDVEERLHRTVSAFKDIFIIIFFISFGTFLDFRQIPGTLPLILIIVPLSILSEIAISSSGAFFSGFSASSALSIGSSMIARGEYSMIYAYLGFSTGAISESLYQFTGVYVFTMTLIAPILMKHSAKTKAIISFAMPEFIKYSTKLVSTTLKPMLLPEESGITYEKTYRFLTHFTIYLALVFASIVSSVMFKGLLIIPLALILLEMILIYRMRIFLSAKIKKIEEQINYHDIHQGPYNLDYIIKFISNLFTAFLAIIALGTALWSFGYTILIVLLVLFIIYLLSVSIYIYSKSNKIMK